MKVIARNLSDYPTDAYIPSLEPPVIIAKHLPEDLCKKVRDVGLSASGSNSGVFDIASGKAIHDSYHRSSSFLTMPNDIYREVEARLTNIVTGYMTSLGKIPVLAEGIQFLKYDSSNSGHFLPHTDNAFYDAHGKFHYTSPQRHITAIAYVNTDYVGGDLILHSVINDNGTVLKLKPNIGEVVIFPSDIRFLHEVTPVTQGCRLSIVGWFSLK